MHSLHSVKACRPSFLETEHRHPLSIPLFGWIRTCSSCHLRILLKRKHACKFSCSRGTVLFLQLQPTLTFQANTTERGALGEPEVGQCPSAQHCAHPGHCLTLLLCGAEQRELLFLADRDMQCSLIWAFPLAQSQCSSKPGSPHRSWGSLQYLPMTAFGSVPKAQMHGEPEGTWNLEKLHLELKYLGRKPAEAKLKERERKKESTTT